MNFISDKSCRIDQQKCSGKSMINPKLQVQNMSLRTNEIGLGVVYER